MLNPKSNNFGQNARIDVLVIFNSSCCRLVGQVLLYFFQQPWASEQVWKTVTSSRAQHHAGKSSTRWNHSVLILVELLTYCGRSGTPFKDFCVAAPASKLVDSALHNSFARLILGCSTPNPTILAKTQESTCLSSSIQVIVGL